MEKWAVYFDYEARGAIDVNAGFWNTDGDVTFGTNYGAKEQEIGRYFGDLDPKRLEKFLLMLRRDVFTLPRYKDFFQPGMAIVSLSESNPDTMDTTAYAAYPTGKIPNAMIPAIDEAVALCNELRRYPIYVVRGEAQWAKKSFKPGEPLAVEVSLINVGKEEITIQTPFHRDENGEGVFQILLQPMPDDPSAKEAYDDEQDAEYIEIPGRHVYKTTRGKPPLSGRVTLKPKEHIDVLIRKRVILAPGRYRAAVVYWGQGEEDVASERIGGRLTMDAGAFSVVK